MTVFRRWLASISYREQLYSARRAVVGQNDGEGIVRGAGDALRRVAQTLREAKVHAAVRARREFVRPGDVASFARMASRKKRFDSLVRERIAEIKQIYREDYGRDI